MHKEIPTIEEVIALTMWLTDKNSHMLVRRWWGEFTGTPPNETGVMVEVLAAGELLG
jgi:hypothetical protein